VFVQFQVIRRLGGATGWAVQRRVGYIQPSLTLWKPAFLEPYGALPSRIWVPTAIHVIGGNQRRLWACGSGAAPGVYSQG
jgi:hypothetical protein